MEDLMCITLDFFFFVFITIYNLIYGEYALSKCFITINITDFITSSLNVHLLQYLLPLEVITISTFLDDFKCTEVLRKVFGLKIYNSIKINQPDDRKDTRTIGTSDILSRLNKKS